MTTVRDLVSVATAELDTVSRWLTSGQMTDPAVFASTWPALMASGQRFVQLATGCLRRDLDTRAVTDALCALPIAPAAAPVRRRDPHLQRAQRAVGAAADLLSEAGVDVGVTTNDRIDTAIEGARLLAAAARITIQATLHYPEYAPTVASAGAVLAACQGVSSRSSRKAKAPSLLQGRSTGLLPYRLKDPLDPIAAAVRDWKDLAVRAANPPAPSSHDLRVVALTAGQLMATVHRLLGAHSMSLSPGKYDPLVKVDLAGRSWSQAARAWDAFIMPSPPNTEVLLASGRVTRSIRDALQHQGTWLQPEALLDKTTMRDSIDFCSYALRVAQDVAVLHAKHVEAYARSGWVLGRADHLEPSLERLPHALRRRWVPANREETSGLAIAYSALSGTARLATISLRFAVPNASSVRCASLPGPQMQPVKRSPAR